MRKAWKRRREIKGKSGKNYLACCNTLTPALQDLSELGEKKGREKLEKMTCRMAITVTAISVALSCSGTGLVDDLSNKHLSKHASVMEKDGHSGSWSVFCYAQAPPMGCNQNCIKTKQHLKK